MPHERKRHLESVLKHLARISPLVGLLGHRQVGKTTLLEAISGHYLSLDDEELRMAASESPKRFIGELQLTGTAIDECQLSEGIFPALKERVRKDKRPGQFYLSGSIRFTSKKLIQESLTGRIMTADLLPMTLSELDRGELPDMAIRLLEAKRVQDVVIPILTAAIHAHRKKLMDQYATHGGLPGACFIRNDRIRAQKIVAQLETILDRDLRQVHETTLTLPELLRFVRQLALHDGTSIQYQDLRRATGISPLTQKKLLYALEATFILRHLPLEGDFRGSAIFFEDHAEMMTLAQAQIDEGRRWAGLVYRNLREQFFYRLGSNAEFFQFRTRGGVLVPFAVRTAESTLGWIPVRGAPSRTAIAAAQSFLRHYSNSKAVLVTDANELRVLDDRTLLIPASSLLFA